ncbi:MAG: FHA domain-containing protein [Thermogutta sp.]|nr:FHA domain-containing protein [Thermogutta sp.]
MYGQLIPLGGGDPIPLLKKRVLVGRRESCDIVLRFSNVSAQHCELFIVSGYWYVRDLNSTNGVKVNGARVRERRLDPGCILSIAKHQYEVRYSPVELGAVGPPPPEVLETDIFSRSLLERAGLVRTKPSEESLPSTEAAGGDGKDKDVERYDILESAKVPQRRKPSP